jgi:hypothetical protein
MFSTERDTTAAIFFVYKFHKEDSSSSFGANLIAAMVKLQRKFLISPLETPIKSAILSTGWLRAAATWILRYCKSNTLR